MEARLGCSLVPQDKTCPEDFWEMGGGLGRGICTYRTERISKVNLQVAHGLDNGHDGLDGVAVDNRPVLPAFFL